MPRFKKILKESLLSLLILGVILNAMSYFRSPTFESKSDLKLNSVTISGHDTQSYERSGKPLLIHFWATWCPTCKLEASNIQRLSRHFNVLTVAVKSGSDADIQEYLNENNLDFEVINDTNGILASRFKVPAFPTTFILNAQGAIAFSEVGYTSSIGLFARMWWAQ